MTPAIIEAARTLLERDLSEAAKIVNAMREGRTNSIGLTDGALRASPEYQAAKLDLDTKFQALRKFNRTYKPPRNR